MYLWSIWVSQKPPRSGVSSAQLTQGLVPGHGDMVRQQAADG